MGTDRDRIAAAAIDLDRDLFLRRLLRELAGSLQEVVGLEEAAGFISVVGTALGEQIDAEYRRALGVERLSRDQVADVLADLKRRIQGDFYVIAVTEDRIVLGNRTCPFGAQVQGRPALCMMTSSIFGHIAAQNLGYAGVELQQTIARGHPGCRVVVHLHAGDDSHLHAGDDSHLHAGDDSHLHAGEHAHLRAPADMHPPDETCAGVREYFRQDDNRSRP